MEKQKVQFSFDHLDILGAIGDDTFIRGGFFETDESEELKPCILIVRKELLHMALDYWIKDKEAYCKRYNEFCGKMGTLRSNDYDVVLPINLLIDYKDIGNDKIEPVYEDVLTVRVNNFDSNTDMEHG